jgi:predicted nucleic acid-binding protein
MIILDTNVVSELMRPEPDVRVRQWVGGREGFDAQIAAICRARSAALATRNVKDFLETGIDVIDPWSA